MRRSSGSRGGAGGRWGWLKENLEAIVGAVTVALLIRTFAAEPYSIPTGSMAPTLFGAHLETTCPTCGLLLESSPPLDRAAIDGQETCPVCSLVGPGGGSCAGCGYPLPRGRTLPASLPASRCPGCLQPLPDPVAGETSYRTGDKILVDKVVYRVRSPRRWEVAVFRRPGEISMNFVKRIVGLPGEEIDLAGGDLLVDGRIVRKGPEVQAGLWFPVFTSERPTPGMAAWRMEGTGWETGEGSLAAVSGEETRARFGRPITDRQGYNAYRGRDGASLVGDIRLRAAVGVDSGEALMIIERNGEEIVSTLGKDGKATLSIGGEEHRADLGSPLAGEVSWVLQLLDGEVTVAVGGREAIRSAVPWGPGEVESSGVALGVRRGGARFERIEIHRDVHYSEPPEGALRFPYSVSRGEYLLFGDNSPSSKDSRYLGPVPAENFVGRAFVVFWPVAPWRIRRIL